MKFRDFLEGTSRLIDAINGVIGRTIAWLSLGMATIVFSLVAARAAFDLGSIAIQELVTYLHASLFMLAMAYTLKHDGHIRVDILYRRLSPEARAWINALGSILLLLPFSLFLIFVSWQATLTSWQILEGSPNTGGIPAMFLLKTLVPVGGALLGLQALAEICRSLVVISYREANV